MDVLPKGSAVIASLCAWVCLVAIYLLLAGQVSGDEIVAGAVCAAAAVIWWVGTRRASDHRFAFDAGSWTAVGRACRHLPSAVLSSAAVLLRTLVRPQNGEVAHWFLAHGRRTDPGDGGRRAIGVLAASLAPDSFVLRTPAERDEIVVHTLVPGEPPKDPRWPI